MQGIDGQNSQQHSFADNIVVKFTWKKTGPESYKLNASFFENGVGAIAAIIRNYQGEAVAGVAELFTFADSEAAAEDMLLIQTLCLVPTLIPLISIYRMF